MAGEDLKNFTRRIAVRDAGHADLSGFSQSASLLERSAGHLDQIANRATNIGTQRREQEAIEAVNSFNFERDENGDLKSPELPDMGPLGFSAFEKKYREGITLRYGNQLQSDAEQFAVEARAKNPTDPTAFKTSFDEYLNTQGASIPAEIRGTMVDRMQKVGDQHYKTMVSSKAAADFDASAKMQLGMIAKSNRDIGMAVANGLDMNTQEGREILNNHVRLVSEYADVFHGGDEDAKGFYVAQEIEQVVRTTAEQSVLRSMLGGPNGQIRQLNDEGYAGALADISKIKDGSAEVMTFVPDLDTGEIVAMPVKIGVIMDEDQRASLAKRMGTIASYGKTRYDANVTVMQNDIQNDASAMLADMMLEGNTDIEEMSIRMSTMLMDRYGNRGQEAQTAVSKSIASLLTRGRSEQDRLINEKTDAILFDLQAPAREAIEKAVGIDPFEIAKGDISGAVDITRSLQAELSRQNDIAAKGMNNAMMRNFKEFTELAAEGGSWEAGVAGLVDSPNVKIANNGGSDAESQTAQSIGFGDMDAETFNKMDPSMVARRAAPFLATGVVPQGIANMMRKVRHIGNENVLPDDQVAQMVAIYDQASLFPNGKYAIQQKLGDSWPTFKRVMLAHKNGTLDGQARALIQEMQDNPKDFTAKGLPKELGVQKIDEIRQTVKDRMSEIDSTLGFGGTQAGRMMARNMEEAVFMMLPLTATADNPEGDLDIAFNAARQYVSSGDGAWVRKNTIFSPDPRTNWVQDRGYNHWDRRGWGTFFDDKPSSGLSRLLFNHRDQIKTERPIEKHTDLDLGNRFVVKSTGKSEYDFMLYEKKTLAAGNVVLSPVMRKDGNGQMKLNIKDAMAEFQEITIKQEAVPAQMRKKFYTEIRDQSLNTIEQRIDEANEGL